MYTHTLLSYIDNDRIENMNWEARRVYGHTPTPRGYHSAVLYDSRIFVFGGYNGQSFFNDVYVLELSSFAYLPQIVNFSINAHNK
jgi:hypothetical protein